MRVVVEVEFVVEEAASEDEAREMVENALLEKTFLEFSITDMREQEDV